MTVSLCQPRDYPFLAGCLGRSRAPPRQRSGQGPYIFFQVSDLYPQYPRFPQNVFLHRQRTAWACELQGVGKIISARTRKPATAILARGFFLAVHVFPPERPRPVLLLPLHGRQEHGRGEYRASELVLPAPVPILHIQACLRCTGRIWAVLGEFWRVWDNRALFLPNLALVKIWGRTRSPGKRPLNF